ncbi:hypothetical protein F5X99DRAFT_411830 [Biscogniauxia marginata]|nr:hypothetical protein F5X99DRAFT_411830 [Biscogniauxia marginata]
MAGYEGYSDTNDAYDAEVPESDTVANAATVATTATNYGQMGSHYPQDPGHSVNTASYGAGSGGYYGGASNMPTLANTALSATRQTISGQTGLFISSWKSGAIGTSKWRTDAQADAERTLRNWFETQSTYPDKEVTERFMVSLAKEVLTLSLPLIQEHRFTVVVELQGHMPVIKLETQSELPQGAKKMKSLNNSLRKKLKRVGFPSRLNWETNGHELLSPSSGEFPLHVALTNFTDARVQLLRFF